MKMFGNNEFEKSETTTISVDFDSKKKNALKIRADRSICTIPIVKWGESRGTNLKKKISQIAIKKFASVIFF